MHMFASVHEVIEQKYFANSQWILLKQIGNLLTLKTQNQVACRLISVVRGVEEWEFASMPSFFSKSITIRSAG